MQAANTAQQTGVALGLFRGVFAEWYVMPQPSWTREQDNLHFCEFRQGAHSLEFGVDVSTLREQWLMASLRLYRDTNDVERFLVYDLNLDLTRAEDGERLARLCGEFMGL